MVQMKKESAYSRLDADIIQDRALDEGDEEVCAFSGRLKGQLHPVPSTANSSHWALHLRNGRREQLGTLLVHRTAKTGQGWRRERRELGDQHVSLKIHRVQIIAVRLSVDLAAVPVRCSPQVVVLCCCQRSGQAHRSSTSIMA